MMRFSLAGKGRPIVVISTGDPGDPNEVSMPYALGFYAVFVAFPTILNDGTNFHKAPIFLLERPW
jgi:hypothetical protein